LHEARIAVARCDERQWQQCAGKVTLQSLSATSKPTFGRHGMPVSWSPHRLLLQTHFFASAAFNKRTTADLRGRAQRMAGLSLLDNRQNAASDLLVQSYPKTDQDPHVIG